MNKKDFPFYISLILGVGCGVLAIYIFVKINGKHASEWFGFVGVIISLIGLILTIKSGINLRTYNASMKYIKLDKKLKEIKTKVPSITTYALQLRTRIKSSRGKDDNDLNKINQDIINYCIILTNLFNNVQDYQNEYDVFLKNGTEKKITTILNNWELERENSMKSLIYIHEELLKTVNNIIMKNESQIDPSLKGILY
ncbi:hypothetical protein [Treponema bryantii]|uniref:hypothetical protein n=1 Tax=Treponema bryantii TaxID=163 RepID=UPI002B3016F9|nr:hypothetical protein TRBR_14550 [Treponema bryantii]